MSERDSYTWSSMFSGYCKNECWEEVLDLFNDMRDNGVGFGEVTLISVLTACGRVANVELGEWIHEYIEETRLTGNICLMTSLIDMDATCYGNIARFINHRCFDANLIEVPVEVETPDRHYYRLAFFTRREIEPFEELTWDYGIQFDENDHLLKAFQCQCGSRFCRNMKRLNDSKSSAAN